MPRNFPSHFHHLHDTMFFSSLFNFSQFLSMPSQLPTLNLIHHIATKCSKMSLQRKERITFHRKRDVFVPLSPLSTKKKNTPPPLVFCLRHCTPVPSVFAFHLLLKCCTQVVHNPTFFRNLWTYLIPNCDLFHGVSNCHHNLTIEFMFCPVPPPRLLFSSNRREKNKTLSKR